MCNALSSTSREVLSEIGSGKKGNVKEPKRVLSSTDQGEINPFTVVDTVVDVGQDGSITDVEDEKSNTL